MLEKQADLPTDCLSEINVGYKIHHVLISYKTALYENTSENETSLKLDKQNCPETFLLQLLYLKLVAQLIHPMIECRFNAV